MTQRLLLSLTQAWWPIEVAGEFTIRGHVLNGIGPAYFFAFKPASAFDTETGLGAISNRGATTDERF
jgi:hypothetical protein